MRHPKPKFSECEIKDGKVYHSGRVAILISGGFGAGWYTWNREHKQCIFDPVIVEHIMNELPEESIVAHCEKKYGKHFYCGGVDGLCVIWLKEHTLFTIEEYDGSESIQVRDETHWISA